MMKLALGSKMRSAQPSFNAMSLLETFLMEPSQSSVWVAVRTDGAKGSGTALDPYNGTTADAFDAAMRAVAGKNQPVTVHLGPGTFYTRGYSDAAPEGGWQAAAKMRIIGAGIDVTTLRLTGMSQTSAQYYAVGHKLAGGSDQGVQADYFEISDLTIDCGITDSTPADFASGAIRAKGNHLRIRRIKAVHWGSKSSTVPSFVIAAIVSDSNATAPGRDMGTFDSLIDGCVIVKPGQGITGSSTLLYAGKAPAASIYACGESIVVRNCFLDGTPAPQEPAVDPLSLSIRAITLNSCHGAIVEGNHVYNVRDAGPCEDRYTIRELIVRNNFYRNVMNGVWLQDWSATSPLEDGVAIAAITRFSNTANTAEVATAHPHSFYAGDLVSISGTGVFDGVREVTDVTGPDRFRFLTTIIGQASGGTARKPGAIHKLLVEGNMFELAAVTTPAPVGIFFRQTGDLAEVTGEVIIRDNRFRYLDGVVDSETSSGLAINVTGAKTVVVCDNIIEIIPSNVEPIQIDSSPSVRCIDNRTPDGVLLADSVNETQFDDMDTTAADALLIACFDK